MTNAFTTANFYGTPRSNKKANEDAASQTRLDEDLSDPNEKRNDILNADLQTVTGDPDAAGQDSSGDVRESDVNNSANAPFGSGLLVAAPAVAGATSKNVVVQKGGDWPGKRV